MEGHLSELQRLLDAQVENLGQLELLISQQRIALTDRDMAAIVENISNQGSCLERVRVIEERRKALVKRITADLGMKEPGTTISEIADRSAGRVADELRATGEAMKETLARIGKVNQENTKHIESSLKVVQDALSAIASNGAPAPVYGATGEIAPQKQRRRLVDETT